MPETTPPEIEPGDLVRFDDSGYGLGWRTGRIVKRGHPFLNGDRAWIVAPECGNPRFVQSKDMELLDKNNGPLAVSAVT